ATRTPGGPGVPAGEGLRHGGGQADAGDLDGLLQGQEQTGPGPLPRRQADELDAVEPDAAVGDGGAGPSHEGVGQGALAGPVRSHDHVDLAAPDGEVDAADYLPAGDLGMQVLDLQHVAAFRCVTNHRRAGHGGHGSTTATSSPDSSTS